MRDPKRIDEFCELLAKAWHKVPDWRFAQLVLNLPYEKDPFFYEDDEMLDLIRGCFQLDDDGQPSPITWNEVLDGMERGVVLLVPDPNTGEGTVCQIGERWFAIGGEAEEMSPNEYALKFTSIYIAKSIADVLQEYEDDRDNTDEWDYYRSVLSTPKEG